MLAREFVYFPSPAKVGIFDESLFPFEGLLAAEVVFPFGKQNIESSQ